MKTDNRCSPVKIRGVTYGSGVEAAKALNVSPNTVYRALQDGTIDTVGLVKWTGKKKRIIYDGKTYESITEFSSAMGVCKVYMTTCINRAKKKGKNYVFNGKYVLVMLD